MTAAAPPPLSLYVHWPWCVRKCPYCDFNSHEARESPPEAAWVDALLAEARRAVPAVQGRRIGTVFVGGGTPSLMSPAAAGRLLDGLRTALPIAGDAEVTLEANPGTVDAARFRGFRAAGVNRLSVGVQSFDDASLRALGRIHDGAAARAAVDRALEAFDDVNLDLMYVLPGQSPAAAAADARTALAAGAAHVSFYQLTIEPNTAFAARPPPLPDPDAAAAIEEEVHALLADAGYVRYEVSAWARPGRECRHNLNYWRFGDYLGLGPGAHGKTTWPDAIVREARTRAPADWLRRVAAGDARAERRVLAPADAAFEFFLNGLRLTAGIPAELLEARARVPRVAVRDRLDAAVGRGLLVEEGGHWRATPLGLRFLNDLLESFLP